MKHQLDIDGYAKVQTFHMAACLECQPILPIPFSGSQERDIWADTHGTATGHEVRKYTSIRITTS